MSKTRGRLAGDCVLPRCGSSPKSVGKQQCPSYLLAKLNCFPTCVWRLLLLHGTCCLEGVCMHVCPCDGADWGVCDVMQLPGGRNTSHPYCITVTLAKFTMLAHFASGPAGKPRRLGACLRRRRWTTSEGTERSIHRMVDVDCLLQLTGTLLDVSRFQQH